MSAAGAAEAPPAAGAAGGSEPAETTGDARVDAALQRLDDLDGLPLGEHVERYERVHAALQAALNAVEQD